MAVERLCTASGVAVRGPLLITPQVFADDRGFFFESWNQRAFAAALQADGQEVPALVQDNHSRSRRGVLRGLHYQVAPHPQAKLVRCVLGTILDVAVDLRRSSATFGQWLAVELSAANYQQLWLPVGFAHGFLTLSEHAEVLYKTSDFWSQGCERGLRWDDPEVAIAWPVVSPQLASKDAAAPCLAELMAAGDLFL